MKFPRKIFPLVFVLVFALLFMTACNDKESENANTEIKQVTVSTAEELFALSRYTGESSKNVVITLGCDIDLSSYTDDSGKIIDWTPIGCTLDNAFQGTLDGKGHKITGLTLQGWVIEKYSGQAYVIDEKGMYVPINGENSFLPQTVTYYVKTGDEVYEAVPSTEPYDANKVYFIKDNLGKYVEYGIDNLDSLNVQTQLYKKTDKGGYEPIGEGTPLYIAKRIIGWDEEGNAVYKSGEIVGFQRDGGTITDIVFEGDSADPKYETITLESSSTSFGSVGFFGYTHGATVKDITFDQANISFYASSEKTFAGIVSGYDVGSTFTDVTVSNSSLLASHLYDKEIVYSTQYATPVNYENQAKATAVEYMGGIVGYSQYNTTAENGYTVRYSTFDNVHVNDIVVDNCGYSAYFDMGITVAEANNAENAHFESTYVTGEGYYIPLNLATTNTITSYMLPREAYIGGIAGYLKEIDYRNLKAENLSSEYVLKNVTVNGLNVGGHGVCGQKLNAGGISAYLTGGKSENLTVQNVNFKSVNQKNNWLVSDSAYVGGSFAMIQSSVITGTTVSDIAFNIQEREAQSVCIGGFTGYAEGSSDISAVSVQTASIETSYTDSGELGAILGGLLGAVRDSSVTGTNTVQDVRFKVDTGSKTGDYKYVSALTAQIYGNSTYLGGTATGCEYYLSGSYTAFTETRSYVYANNYVNENGEQSARLYYMQNGRYAGVYVTVFGELLQVADIGSVPCSLHEEKVWKQISSSEMTLKGAKIDINNASDTYAYYAEATQKWNKLTFNSTDENLTVKEGRLYAKEVTLLRVDSEGLVGKSLNGLGLCIYDEKTATITELTTGTVERNQTYYLSVATASAYELRITVYAENGDILALDDSGDNLAEEIRYAVTLERYNSLVGSEGCVAERFLSVYFENGFKPGKDGTTVTDAEKNRDFTKYEIVTGRANVAEEFIMQ